MHVLNIHLSGFFLLLSLSKGWRFVLYEWEDSGVIMSQSQTGGQSCGSGPSLCICSRQAGSLTTVQHLEPSPVSFFQTIKCTSGLLLFGWPGDMVFWVSSVFLSPFLTSVVSFCVYGNPVDGCFLLKARQSVKLLLWKDSWQWLSLQNTFTRYWFLGQLLMLNYGNAVCQHCLSL